MSKSLIIAIISIGSLSYLGFGLYLYLAQERLLFRPDLAPKDIELPEGVERLFIDGIEVGFIDHGSDKTIFYFGGNANNALEALHLFENLPFNAVAFNYPGYGNSKGRPSQQAIFQAAKKIFDRFKNDHNILVGRSLGTGVAAYIASLQPVDKIILITPYHSITHLAQLNYPIYPVKWILKHPFETYRYIAKSDAPVYVILASEDETTPPETFEKLKPYIKNLKKIYTIQAHHDDILSKVETKEMLKRLVSEEEPH